jgi:hypothetical protein
VGEVHYDIDQRQGRLLSSSCIRQISCSAVG